MSSFADDILKPTNATPTADLDDRWQQQTHFKCGGELVLIFQESTQRLAVICKGCRDIWFLRTEERRGPWVSAKPVNAGGGLWVPGKAGGIL